MADVSGLLSWFQANGGSLDASVGFKMFLGCGRGAVALADIPEGHVLFTIPRGLLLSTETSGLPGNVGFERWKTAKMHIGWAGLILCMMWETAQGPRSRWAQYLGSLPTAFDTPMFWSDLELEQLKGTSVVGKLGKEDAERDFTEKLIPLVRSRPDLFPPETIPQYYTLEIYHVMGSRILSRSFNVEKDEPEEEEREEGETPAEEDGADASGEDGVGNTSLGSAMEVDGEVPSVHSDDSESDEDEDEDEPSAVAMVPLADMLNAQYGSENAKLFYEKDVLRMMSTKSIPLGEQIWNTYGDLPNAELLRRYGHVDLLPLPGFPDALGNPGDIVELPADLAVPSDADADAIKARIDWWLEQGGDDVLVLESDLEIPPALASLIRLLRLPVPEWEKAVAKDKPPKPVLDAEVLGVVRTVLERRRDAYPTPLAEDLLLLGAPDADLLPLHTRHALIVRIGEKRIIEGALQKVAGLLAAGDGKRKRKGREEEGEGRAGKTKTRRRG
ncbi:SET domain-containing protein [Mycena belliarum]|uniref:SET domain-containing protein n=1 Tax=Mycena belliarum TaxID=1033014 RepID=A0AAD6XTJ4_9AGAR|nr:SET domain-containing protein [Mycena belliae]